MPRNTKRNSKGQFVSNNGNGYTDESVMNRLLMNQVFSRRGLLEFARDTNFNRERFDAELGYPLTRTLVAELFREMYDREPIATRVVEVMPMESWKVTPNVFESEDVDNKKPFDEAFDRLGENFTRGSWFNSPDESSIWQWLVRADILSGIGSYGIILLGIDDDAETLEEPVESVESGTPSSEERELLFIRTFDESLVEIVQFENDENNPRFGQPVMYQVTFNDPKESVGNTQGLAAATKNVHWTRVIHVADNLMSSEVFGVSRLRPAFNRLHDLRKLYGGSAEMYWKGAFPGISIETHPSLGANVKLDPNDHREQMEDYMKGMQRYLALSGASAKSLSPQVADPAKHIDSQLEAICIQIGIPKRVFLGSERGELASSQDSKAWNDRLRYRQNMYLTPRLIVPIVDRLILMGVLPQPESYNIEWPSLEELSEAEKATIAVNVTKAMAQYSQGGIESALMTPQDYHVEILGFSEDKAEQFMDNVEEAEKELQEEREDMGLDPLTGLPPQEPPPEEDDSGNSPSSSGDGGNGSGGGEPVGNRPFDNASGCGAGSPGRKGFQPGNTCAQGGGSGGSGIAMFSSEEVEAIKTYQLGGIAAEDGGPVASEDFDPAYIKINSSLREGREPSEEIGEVIDNLDSAFNKTEVKDVGVLYRGTTDIDHITSLVGEEIEEGTLKDFLDDPMLQSSNPGVRGRNQKILDKLKGLEFTDKGFVSTTRSKDVLTRVSGAEAFAKGLINHPPVQFTITGKSKFIEVPESPWYFDELDETLLPRGTTFKIKEAGFDIEEYGFSDFITPVIKIDLELAN